MKISFPLSQFIKDSGWVIVSAFMLFLPFQMALFREFDLPRYFLWMDEGFIVISVILFVAVIVHRKAIPKAAKQILLAVSFLCIAGIISGLYNRNPLIVTFNGIFDYVKNFLAIPIFCSFVMSQKKTIDLYRMFHYLALFLCMVAVFQELVFLFGFPVQFAGVSFVDVRFGLMRTPSLMGHPNIFGLYMLLFFTMDFSIQRRVRWQNILFAAGIVLSISRMNWIALFLVALIFLIRQKSTSSFLFFVLGLVLMALIVAPINLTPTRDTSKGFLQHTTQEMKSEKQFRGYALNKSLEIWKDEPVVGVGPGMYGGTISFIFDSPIYDKYEFSPRWFEFMSKFRSLDQFWPQIMVEMGLMGALAFVFLVVTLWRTARKVSLASRDPVQKKMLFGFSILSVVLIVYLLGSGLNLTAFLLTYTILFGMVLGMKDESASDQQIPLP